MIFWPSNKQSSPTNNEIIMCCYLTNKSTSKFYWLNNLLVIIHVGHFLPSVECEFTSWVLVKGNIIYSVSLVVISDKDKRTQCYSNALQEHEVILRDQKAQGVTSLYEANGDVPLDGVAFSRLDWL